MSESGFVQHQPLRSWRQLIRGKDFGNWLLGRREQHKGMLAGVDGCGKTTLLYRWKLNEVVTTIPTVGFNVETVPCGWAWDFVLWDVGGSDRIRPLLRHYFSSTQFVIFIHNCNDHERRDVQIQEFHNTARNMIDFGCRYIWVLFNQQDQLQPGNRDEYVRDLIHRYHDAASSYSGSLYIKALDIPHLSATKSTDARAILDDIKQTLQRGELGPVKATPSAKLGPNQAFNELKDQAEDFANADDTTPEQFWQSFVSGDLPVWDHYNYLKAGYLVIVDGSTSGRSVMDSAEIFVMHLERLMRDNPERFHNVTHRSMIIFWLLQLKIAALNYKREANDRAPLSREDFRNVLLHTPQLTNSGLWKDYYSKERLFNPDARERWCLPDLQSLPVVVVIGSSQSATAAPVQYSDDSDRLIGFALMVAKKTLATKARRGAVVNNALATLQSSIIRKRLADPSIPPYSETKAYFWIQFVHDALAGLGFLEPPSSSPESVDDMAGWDGSMDALTLPSFKTLLGITGGEWREHYSPSRWESIAARITFLNPDLKSLAGDAAVASGVNVQSARSG